jgi:hypothetical protein
MGRFAVLAGSLFFFASLAFADNAPPDFLFEVSYSGSSVSPSQLNDARRDFYWNNTTPGSGSFKDLSGFGASIGYQFFDGVYLLLQMKELTQNLGSNSISGGGYSVTEAFEYTPIYLLADVPFQVDDWLTLSIRGGLGYAYHFELRQQVSSNNELVIWGGHPIPIQFGGTADFLCTDWLGIYFGVHYEYVKSTLKAESNYQTTFNGQAITSGQTYTNVSTGSTASADMSGMYYELGLRFTF